MLAAALLITGCGSSSPGDTADAARVVAASAEKTAAAKNARMSTVTQFQGPTGLLTEQSDGIVDLATNNERTSFSAGTSGLVDLLLIDGSLYVRFPVALRPGLGGKEWVAMDGTSAAANRRQDQAGYLKALERLNGSIIKVGTETIRGTRTIHFVADVAIADVMKAEGGTRAVADGYEELGVSRVPVDIFLDEKGLVRRITLAVTPTRGSQRGQTTRTVTDYYDFGKANTAGLVAPPASDTIDVDQVPALQDFGLKD
jgi:hypothetical protein